MVQGPRLSKLRVRNFRCLKDVTLRFTPLTILVGPNGAGKSSILRALQGGLPTGQLDAELEQAGRFSGGPGSGVTWKQQLVHLNPKSARKPNQVQGAPQLVESGENLVNVWATMPRVQRDKLARQFCELVPIFSDVDERPTSGWYHELRFRDRWRDVWFAPNEVSDGSILTLAFLVLTQSLSDLDVLAVEEPEHGIHPYLVQRVIALLRDIATGKFERTVQVVVATQSPVVLDAAQPEEVRFISRDEATGETTISEAPTGTEDWRAAYDEYSQSLGALWLSGSLGGVPGSP
jgi:predicted ATPase